MDLADERRPSVGSRSRVSDNPHTTFRACIWLNPMPEGQWNRTTINLVRQIFPMYELTLDGLERGIKQLVRKVG